MRKKKGQAFVMFIYLLGIVAIGFAILVMMGPMKTLFDDNAANEHAQDDDIQQFFTRSRTIWMWLPILLIFPMILWALSKAHERSGYG